MNDETNEPRIGEAGWILVEIFTSHGAIYGTTIHHEKCPHPKPNTEMRPGSPEELARGIKVCGTCQRRLASGPTTKTVGGLKVAKDDTRDFETLLKDRADLEKWMKERQQARRYNRQVKQAIERGEVAEAE